jgi:hypothetical protein
MDELIDEFCSSCLFVRTSRNDCVFVELRYGRPLCKYMSVYKFCTSRQYFTLSIKIKLRDFEKVLNITILLNQVWLSVLYSH